MTVREIQAFLAEMYGVDVSPDLISTVTDGIVGDVTAWQRRPLEPMYPVVFFDALRVKIRAFGLLNPQAEDRGCHPAIPPNARYMALPGTSIASAPSSVSPRNS